MSQHQLYTKLAELERSGIRAALCIIVATQGSTPRKKGAKMIVTETGETWGSIGGGTLELKVIEDAQQVIKEREARTFRHALVHDHGMCCGGQVTLYIEPVINMKKLYIFGAGHIGKALARLAGDFDFAVTVIDERPEMTEALDPKTVTLITRPHAIACEELEFDVETLICVITHDHAYDREIVAFCAKQPHLYLGMIGSRRKVEVARKTFLAGEILTEAEMEDIDWPMGVPIHTNTPAEIAISILARLIDVRTRWEEKKDPDYRKKPRLWKGKSQ